MDYQKFTQQYEIIHLSGLKGQENNALAQDRNSFKVYDYAEIIHRGTDIDRKINFLKTMHSLEHKNISKLHNYSYLFVQESHGDPFCKFFLVFEYCEQGLCNELEKLKSQKQFLSRAMILKLTYQLTDALSFLQDHQIPTMVNVKNIYINDQGDFKLLVLDNQESQQNKIDKHLKDLKSQIVSQIKKEQDLKLGLRPLKARKSEEKQKKRLKRFYSPEEFENIHSVLQVKYTIDLAKAEMFNLGIIVLQSGLQENMDILYKNYKFNEKLLQSYLSRFQEKYGEYFSKIIKLILAEQSQRLIASDTMIMLENELAKQKQEQIGVDVPEVLQMLPQEYQADLDNTINAKIKKIEDQCPIQMYSNGDRFRGWKDEQGLVQGWAQYWFAKGQKYEGQFKDGKYNGLGEPNNEIYFGMWRNGKNHGYGTYFWGNGARFSGQFQQDNIMGKGTLVLPETDGKSVRHYDGLWVDNGHLGFVTQKSGNVDQIQN